MFFVIMQQIKTSKTKTNAYVSFTFFSSAPHVGLHSQLILSILKLAGNNQGRSQPYSPGWARVPLSSFFLKSRSIFLIFPQTLLIFFIILALQVGESPTREGPGYATGNNPHVNRLRRNIRVSPNQIGVVTVSRTVLRGHNWVHFSHRSQCTIIFYSKFVIFFALYISIFMKKNG